jgi:hypothetical protein
MGMVFAARRTWIDPDQLPLILNEDGYRKLPGLDEAEVGDVVVYRHPGEGHVTHVGMVIEVKIDVARAARALTVLSKWGQHGEYVHALSDVPVPLGVPVEVWTDRRPVP